MDFIERLAGLFHFRWGSRDLGAMKTKTIAIHAVVFREDRWVVLQCLEHDISAQAQSVESVKEEFMRILEARVEVAAELGLSEPFEALPKAPARFFEMYKSGDAEQAAPRIIATLIEQCVSIQPTIRIAHELV